MSSWVKQVVSSWVDLPPWVQLYFAMYLISYQRNLLTIFHTENNGRICGHVAIVTMAFLIPEEFILFGLKLPRPLQPSCFITSLVQVQQSTNQKCIVIYEPWYRCRSVQKEQKNVFKLFFWIYSKGLTLRFQTNGPKRPHSRKIGVKNRDSFYKNIILDP